MLKIHLVIVTLLILPVTLSALPLPIEGVSGAHSCGEMNSSDSSAGLAVLSGDCAARGWKVRCLTPEEIRERGGTYIACDGNACEVLLVHRICRFMGYTDGKPIKSQDEINRIKRMKPKNPQEADDACALRHELEHTLQGEGQVCDHEQEAFDAQEKCLKDFYEIVCTGESPAWDPGACGNLAGDICAARGGSAINKCVCDIKKELKPGQKLDKKACVDRCSRDCQSIGDSCINGYINWSDPGWRPGMKQGDREGRRVYCHNSAIGYCK